MREFRFGNKGQTSISINTNNPTLTSIMIGIINSATLTQPIYNASSDSEEDINIDNSADDDDDHSIELLDTESSSPPPAPMHENIPPTRYRTSFYHDVPIGATANKPQCEIFSSGYAYDDDAHEDEEEDISLEPWNAMKWDAYMKMKAANNMDDREMLKLPSHEEDRLENIKYLQSKGACVIVDKKTSSQYIELFPPPWKKEEVVDQVNTAQEEEDVSPAVTQDSDDESSIHEEAVHFEDCGDIEDSNSTVATLDDIQEEGSAKRKNDDDEDDDGGISKRRKVADNSPQPQWPWLIVDRIVHVQSRTGPRQNRPGGLGRITKVYTAEENSITHVDVRYVESEHGIRDSHIPIQFVSDRNDLSLQIKSGSRSMRRVTIKTDYEFTQPIAFEWRGSIFDECELQYVHVEVL